MRAQNTHWKSCGEHIAHECAPVRRQRETFGIAASAAAPFFAPATTVAAQLWRSPVSVLVAAP
eukprot:6205201-Pleurochrysis_carterae.AAC.1